MSFANVTVSLQQACAERLRQIDEDGRLRHLLTVDACDGPFARYEGRRMLNLSANDYLGIAGDTRRGQEFTQHLMGGDSELRMSASASRLLGGDHTQSDALEADVAAAYGKRCSALVLNSGYHANLGVLPALTQKRDLVLVDKLAHASIIDGMRLCGATCMRYRHGDLDHLASLLSSRRDAHDNVFVATESIFSMDGDLADLCGLVELKKRYGFTLYVDEAHAVGVRGARGLGMCEELGLLDDVDILLGTFGKALASVGAFVVVAKSVKDLLVNTMRPLIYSTALPPLVLSWTREVFSDMQGMQTQRQSLTMLATRFRDRLRALGCHVLGDSQIVPVIIGSNEPAVTCAADLRREGFLVFPIRPPTVPAGTARVRFSLNAAMRWKDIARLPELVAGGAVA